MRGLQAGRVSHSCMSSVVVVGSPSVWPTGAALGAVSGRGLVSASGPNGGFRWVRRPVCRRKGDGAGSTRGRVGAGTRPGITKSGLPRKKRHSASSPSAMAAPRPILPPHHVRPPCARRRQFQHHAGIAEPHVACIVRRGQCRVDHRVSPEPRRAEHVWHGEPPPQLALPDTKRIGPRLCGYDGGGKRRRDGQPCSAGQPTGCGTWSGCQR
ncbi:MAG: hypothetical protein RLZZ437_3026 [Pseudomonadota bacterium]